ncbi:hypothetical protein [Agromyces silvae]|uniref:hypothetical protein n=1 Tax=Agromyces silvae TaxID=3388266 RepID=UPI00280BEB1F|nr:hypothetical protein [Agromyces protaetiae]
MNVGRPPSKHPSSSSQEADGAPESAEGEILDEDPAAQITRLHSKFRESHANLSKIDVDALRASFASGGVSDATVRLNVGLVDLERAKQLAAQGANLPLDPAGDLRAALEDLVEIDVRLELATENAFAWLSAAEEHLRKVPGATPATLGTPRAPGSGSPAASSDDMDLDAALMLAEDF